MPKNCLADDLLICNDLLSMQIYQNKRENNFLRGGNAIRPYQIAQLPWKDLTIVVLM